MCQFHPERTISLRMEDVYIYIRGYATIRGGRKYFIRGVERKKDPGLDEFRSFLPSWDRARTILITLFFPINNLAYIIIIIIILQVWGIGKLL